FATHHFLSNLTLTESQGGADQPAINLQRNSRHITRSLRGQERDDLSELARLADSPQRNFSRLFGEIFFASDSPLSRADIGERVLPVSHDVPGQNRVAGDVVWADLIGHRLCQSRQPRAKSA